MHAIKYSLPNIAINNINISNWVLAETHKELKRATRVQYSWIFIFLSTIFGNPSLHSTHELWPEDGLSYELWPDLTEVVSFRQDAAVLNSLPSQFEIISNRNAQLIQNSITWLKEKSAKTLWSVAAFLAKLNGSMKLFHSERPRIIFRKSLPTIGFKMWYRFGVSWKLVVFIVQSWLKQYDFSIVDGELNVVVPGSEAADWICMGKQQWIKQLGKLSFNLFCITFSLSEHLELLELRATSTAGKTMLFCVVYRRRKRRLFFFSLFTLILVANHRKRVTLKYY